MNQLALLPSEEPRSSTNPVLPSPAVSDAALRELLDVLRAFRRGDFSVRASHRASGLAGDLVDALNDVIALSERMASDLAAIKVAVGDEGRLGRRINVGERSGDWRTSVESVNGLVGALARPMADVGRVIAAVATGDVTQPMPLELDGRPLEGEIQRTARSINELLEQLATDAYSRGPGGLGSSIQLLIKERRIREQAERLRRAHRRERERAIADVRRNSELRYKNLAESIPQIVFTADPLGLATYFNQRWFQYTGLSSWRSRGTGWTVVLHAADLETHRRRWKEAVRDSTVFELSVRLLGRDGQYRWHICRAVPERGSSGEVLGWLGTFTDFDDQKRAYDAAEAAVHVREEFLSIASHELRTPLSTLRLRLEGIARDLGDRDPGLARKVASAMRQGARLSTLTDTLLDVSRITQGRLTLQKERFDLAEAVQQVVESFSEVSTMVGCRLDLRVVRPTSGWWDRFRIEQVLQNLIANALKYAAGKPIEIDLDGTDETAIISVRDHGMGIAPEAAARIFDRFERAVPARHFGGLGLGLYISRQIVEAHAGTIHVQDTPGGGATFVVTLPFTIPIEQSSRPPGLLSRC